MSNETQQTAQQTPPQPAPPVPPQPAYVPPVGQPYQQYQMPSTGQPYQQPYAQPGYAYENPGQNLGIIGIVLNVLGIGIGGLILGILSRNKSREAGMPTTIGTVSLVWGIIEVVIGFIAGIIFIIAFIIALSDPSIAPANTSSTLY